MPDIALKQIRRIVEEIQSLDEMPLRYPIYEKQLWKGKALRKLVVDNFIVFYLPIERKREVAVLHIFYGGRNIEDYLD